MSDEQRPRIYGDCLPGGFNDERPCPFVSCRHHLYLDVNPATGRIKWRFPGEVEEMKDSCSLDVAREDGKTLEGIAHLFNLTRERVRQIEIRALVKLNSINWRETA